MRSLIIHPTSTALWHAVLNEAQNACSIRLKEDLESYLVFLLMRFTDNPASASSVLGLDFLEGHQAHVVGSNRQYQLKEVGDKCLLYAGLFPGRAQKKRVKVSYFVKLGQAAYCSLSQYLNMQEELFIKLCHEFPRLMDVLQAMRESSHTTLDLLQSLELWHETGSQLAWQRLCEATEGLPVIMDSKKSFH